MTRVLYVLTMPESASDGLRRQERNRVVKEGEVGRGGTSVAEPLSQRPGERTVTGWFRGELGSEMAAELEELFSSGGFEPVVLRGEGEDLDDAGYYDLENVDGEYPDDRTNRVYRYDGRLVRQGTQADNRRAVETSVTRVDHPFGNDTTAYIGIPAEATKVRWFDGVSQLEEAALAATRAAELGDVDIYDVDTSSFDDPMLVFDLPYDREGYVDATVWDDYGRATKEATVTVNGSDETYVQWSRVFSPRHDYSGTPVIENGLIRLDPKPASNALQAFAWDNGAGSWSSTALGTSDWELYDWDVRSLSPSAVRSVAEFRDSTQSPTEYYKLLVILRRGADAIQFDRTNLESSAVPAGLEDLLAPIADSSIRDPGAEQGLVERDSL